MVGKKSDRHSSTFVVRLPESYRVLVKELARRNRRPITQEVQIAIDSHLSKNKDVK